MLIFRIFSAAIILSTWSAGARAETIQVGEVTFERCMVEGSGSVYSAWCGTVQVPENWQDKNGRHIGIALTWLPARRDGADVEPIVMLAGGPGQGARASYPGVRYGLAKANEDRPVLLYDQRGTGDSQALHCQLNDDLNPAEQPEEAQIRQLASDCREQYASVGLEHYTTDDAARDLDFIRQRLRYDQLNVAGVSYGTRLAQRYASLYPKSTRTLLLDSPVPSDLVLLAEHGRSLDAAIEARLENCALDEACLAKNGDPRVSYDNLRIALAQEPSRVSYRDARSGELKSAMMTLDHFAGVMRLLTYGATTAVILPELLNRTEREGFETVLSLSEMLSTSLMSEIAHGMQLSVLCSESMPYIQEVDRMAEEDTLLGTQLIRFSELQCEDWPSKAIAPDFYSTAQHDIPTLILSGSLDPVTPAHYGARIRDRLNRAQHMVLNGEGHSVMSIGCLPEKIGVFMSALDVGQDTECVDNWQSLPVFTGPYGWEP
jgi:pimeloyl-ACP methyl ester carboxylesterase